MHDKAQGSEWGSGNITPQGISGIKSRPTRISIQTHCGHLSTEANSNTTNIMARVDSSQTPMWSSLWKLTGLNHLVYGVMFHADDPHSNEFRHPNSDKMTEAQNYQLDRLFEATHWKDKDSNRRGNQSYGPINQPSNPPTPSMPPGFA